MSTRFVDIERCSMLLSLDKENSHRQRFHLILIYAFIVSGISPFLRAQFDLRVYSFEVIVVVNECENGMCIVFCIALFGGDRPQA